MTVFKYRIPIGDYVELKLPKGAKILSVAAQNDEPFLWALVNPNMPWETRLFRFAGTGHPITEPPERLQFISTFQMRHGSLIFHFFEII